MSELSRIENQIGLLVSEAAASIRRSLDIYWPADAEGRNDACEANLSVHLGHILLSRNFSVFAEVDHPNDDVRGIDLLGISPGNQWFLACEFKRLYSEATLLSMLVDVDRLSRFWLNTGLKAERCGEDVVRIARGCSQGYGLVAGLNWVKGRNRFTELWNHHSSAGHAGVCESFRQKLIEMGAIWSAVPVRAYGKLGSYVWLNAFFPIVRQV